jgi:hypothetical protein
VARSHFLVVDEARRHARRRQAIAGIAGQAGHTGAAAGAGVVPSPWPFRVLAHKAQPSQCVHFGFRMISQSEMIGREDRLDLDAFRVPDTHGTPGLFNKFPGGHY